MLHSCLLVAMALVGSVVAKQYMDLDPNQDLVRSIAGEYLVVSLVGETKRLLCEQIIAFPHGTLICETSCMASVSLKNVTVDQDGKTIKCGPSLFVANRVGDAKYDEFFITAKHVVFDIDIPTTCDVTSGVQIIFARPGSNIKGDENVDKRIKSKITDMTRCDKIETINVGSKYSVALTFEEAGQRKEVWEAIKDKTVVIDGDAHSFTSCMRKAELDDIDDKKEHPTSSSTETIAELITTTVTSTETTSTTTITTGSTTMGTTSTTTTKGKTTTTSTTKETTTPSTSYVILITILIASVSLNICYTFKNVCIRVSHKKAVQNPTDNHAPQDHKEEAYAANTDGIWGDLTETPEDIMRNKEAEDLLIREEGPSTVNNADKKIKKSSCFTIEVEPKPDQRSQLLPKPKKLKKPGYLESNSTTMTTINYC